MSEDALSNANCKLEFHKSTRREIELRRLHYELIRPLLAVFAVILGTVYAIGLSVTSPSHFGIPLAIIFIVFLVIVSALITLKWRLEFLIKKELKIQEELTAKIDTYLPPIPGNHDR